MRLLFTSSDLANTTLVNAATLKPVYEVFSSPPSSAERFTTLRHSPAVPPAGEQPKERWEGKFVGSIEWGEGLLDEEERAEGNAQEGWIVWAKPDAPKRELGALLRPIEGKGKMARVFTGHMRADYVWQFQRFMLPHKPAILQLSPAVSPDPIVTYHPPPHSSRPSRADSTHSSADKRSSSRRSFSLSRSPTKQRPKSSSGKPKPSEDSHSAASEEQDPEVGYIDISPRALQMLDLVLLTLLCMALSPSTQSHVTRSASLSGRLSLRSPPGSSGSGVLSWAGKPSSTSAAGSTAVSSAGTGSVPSTPEDEGDVISPVPMHGSGATGAGAEKKGWRELIALHTPSPTIIANGFEAGMDKLRRLSFPGIGRPRIGA